MDVKLLSFLRELLDSGQVDRHAATVFVTGHSLGALAAEGRMTGHDWTVTVTLLPNCADPGAGQAAMACSSCRTALMFIRHHCG